MPPLGSIFHFLASVFHMFYENCSQTDPKMTPELYKIIRVFSSSYQRLAGHKASKPRSLEASKPRGASAGIAKRNQFLSICNVKHFLGAAMTPQHQGLCERNHQVTLGNQMILMQAVTNAHPQEWPALLPVVEYVQDTAPSRCSRFLSARYVVCLSLIHI